MKTKCHIVDTTLRDGEQSAGIAFSIEDKVRLALLMDEAGIYQIEAGIPALGKSEKEAITRIMSQKRNAVISAWSQMEIEDIKAAMECEPDLIHISVPVSYVHVYTKLKKNKQWVRNKLMECVEYAMSRGNKVTVGFEDASRADISFIISLTTQLEKLGVSHVRYADTVGILTPHTTENVVKSMLHYTRLPLELHIHNDFGMAVANSLEAAKQGAKYIDCTFLGIGERAGNCDLFKLVKASDKYFNFGITKQEAYQVQKEVYTILTKR